MEYKVAINPRAKRDLLSIWKHISKDNPTAASSFCHDLAQQAYSLRIFPERGSESHSRPNVWKIPFQRYLIFYKIFEAEGRVEILRFWHSARDQGRLRLKEEPSIIYSPFPGVIATVPI